MNHRKRLQRRRKLALSRAGILRCLLLGAASSSILQAADPAPGNNPITFNKDIAPIIFQNCAECHRPGQAAPFSLLNYSDVKKKADTIVEVTQNHTMPPWLPEEGYGKFVGERRLSAKQIETIKGWVDQGSKEGDPSDLPAVPSWPEGWQLGKPDLVVTFPQSYQLPAEGKDIYRNFVIPIQMERNRFVRALEFRPGNSKVVHHAFIEVDPSGQARHFVDGENPPGFYGMQLPDSIQMPGGQMLGWQPGKPPLESSPGLAWPLEKNADVVLQLHMHPTGKPEPLKPEVGFYFTDTPPTNMPFRLNLMRSLIDIPAGESNYTIENRYVLPVDAELLRILPHTHYLGKDLQGYAILPDGTKKWLLWIKNWDFNWQADYRYETPVFLPKGSTLVMHFTYDNSAANPHNPSHPPREVKFGLQSSDEMGELWFQLLLKTPKDRQILANDFFVKFTRDAVEENETLLKQNPEDGAAHKKLGVALLMLGHTVDATEHLKSAVKFAPQDEEAHTALAGLLIRQGQLAEAKKQLEAVLELNPNDYQSYGGLGTIALMQRDLKEAQRNYKKALELNPADPIARANLQRVESALAGQAQ
ncbi:MAG: tetratricopeptide repeat protein [Verrucomicrobiota bacterium]